MKKIRTIVRDGEGNTWTGVLYLESAERLIGSLSSDPNTMTELVAGFQQFEQPGFSYTLAEGLIGFQATLVQKPLGAGMLLLDLAGKRIAYEASDWVAYDDGEVNFHDGQAQSAIMVPYRLHEDWEVSNTLEDWERISKSRAKRFKGNQLEARAVLYGPALMRHIVSQVRLWIPEIADLHDYDEVWEAMNEIHEAWILSERDDLGGMTPRRWMMKHLAHLTTNLEDRCRSWNETGFEPPQIQPDSIAYRFGGIGRHESILYYDLIRHLLHVCWKRHAVDSDAPQVVGSELQEVEFLTSEANRWLNEPIPEFFGKSPRSIIERERVRLPELLDPCESVIDCDCPICAMIAEAPGKNFWHMDDSYIPFESPFCMDEFCDWEGDEDDDSEDDLENDDTIVEDDEDESPSLEDAPHTSPVSPSKARQPLLPSLDRVFQSIGPVTQSIPSSESGLADNSMLRMFLVGTKLGELIDRLKQMENRDKDFRDGARTMSHSEKESPSGRQCRSQIDALMRQWGNLREVIQGKDGNRDSLVDPVMDQLRGSIDDILEADPNLELLCVAVQRSLDQLEAI